MTGGGNSLLLPSILPSYLSSAPHLSRYASPVSAFTNPCLGCFTHSLAGFHLSPNWVLPTQMPSTDPIPHVFNDLSPSLLHPPKPLTLSHKRTLFFLKKRCNIFESGVGWRDEWKEEELGELNEEFKQPHFSLFPHEIDTRLCSHPRVCICFLRVCVCVWLPVGVPETSQAH